MDICIECKVRPIVIKKRKLCLLCYHNARKECPDSFRPKLTTPFQSRNTGSLVSNNGVFLEERELEFIRSFFKHGNWIAKPAMFNLGNKEKYTPDFYDGERNTFIEVAGTRQAYEANKEKYQTMKERFPLILFEIRQPNGELLQFDNGRALWIGEEELASRQAKNHEKKQERELKAESVKNRRQAALEKYRQIIAEYNQIPVSKKNKQQRPLKELAAKYGCNSNYICRIVRDYSKQLSVSPEAQI